MKLASSSSLAKLLPFFNIVNTGFIVSNGRLKLMCAVNPPEILDDATARTIFSWSLTTNKRMLLTKVLLVHPGASKKKVFVLLLLMPSRNF